MSVIYKYPITRNTSLMLPIGAKPLCVHEQDDGVVMWCLVDLTKGVEERTFTFVGTGWTSNDSETWNYIGTAFVNEFVWHVFETTGVKQ